MAVYLSKMAATIVGTNRRGEKMYQKFCSTEGTCKSEPQIIFGQMGLSLFIYFFPKKGFLDNGVVF